MPSRVVAWIISPILIGGLIVQYGLSERVTVGEMSSTAAVIIALLGGS